MWFLRGEKYHLGLGESAPDEALYLGERFSRNSYNNQVFVFPRDPSKAYILDLADVKRKKGFFKAKSFLVKKFSKAEGELVKKILTLPKKE